MFRKTHYWATAKMDEGYRDDRLILHSQRIKNESKKEFIEKWLVNLAASYDERGIDNKDLDSKLATLESENARSSQLDFWDVSENNYKSRKKVSKLQFLNALKNIFKKKKGIYGNDVMVGNSLTESAFNIMSLDTYKQENTSEGLVEEEQTTKSSEDIPTHVSHKKDDSTQTALGGRATAGVAAKPMDQFSRGFSEILQPKGYNFQEEIIESMSMSSISQMVRSQPESRETLEELYRDQECQDEATRVSRIQWAVIEEDQDGGLKNVAQHHDVVDWPLRCLKCGMDQVDSYVEKLQLIKRFFAKQPTKSTNKTKTSLTLISVPILNPCSVTSDSLESSAITKDLTDVPYLREHERVQWQGKNKGLWFRINALYSKYRRNGMELNRDKLGPKPITSRSERSNATGKPRTGFNSKTSSRKTVPPQKVKITKVTSFGSMERHAKLEEMFVSERVKHLEIQLEPFISRPLEKGKSERTASLLPLYMKEKSRAKVWHETVEQVRASMRKMSEEMVDALRCASHLSSREMRCQSKTSVAMSSSDWEDVSSISVESNTSRHTFSRIVKPLPNIPYTPSFKRHFRPKF